MVEVLHSPVLSLTRCVLSFNPPLVSKSLSCRDVYQPLSKFGLSNTERISKFKIQLVVLEITAVKQTNSLSLLYEY